MNAYPMDMMILEAITRLVSNDPKKRFSYEQIETSVKIPVCTRTVKRSIARLERDGHLRRIGGMTRNGYFYELSTTVRMDVAVRG